jgi:integrase/recombinase XerC
VAPTVALTDVLGELTDAYELAGRSPHTVLPIARATNGLIKTMTDAGVSPSIENVTRTLVTQFLAQERKRGLKPASLSNLQRSLNRLFSWSVEAGILDRNPAKGIPSISVNPDPVRFVTDEEFDRLLASIEPDTSLTGRRDLALILFLSDTGGRRGEVLGLRLQDVDLAARTAYVRSETSKTRRSRTVGYSARTSRALRVYLRARNAYVDRVGMTTDALWVNAKRGPLQPNGALQALERRCIRAGLAPVTLHSFRHRMASRAIQNGLPMTYLMAVGGWKSAAVPTARYGQFEVEGRAIEAMQRLLERP